MFIGHWAPAFVAGAVSSESPRLGTLFVAAQLVDWAFMALIIVGVEKMTITPGITRMNPLDLYHMPYTHSLLGTGIFAVVFGLIVGAMLRNRFAGLVAGMVVISHWLLDLVVHRPDLTLAGGEEKLGWGLWNYPWITVPLEIGITVGALYWYVKSTKGPMGPPIILLVVLLAMQGFNWFGPEPTEMSVAFPITGLVAFGVATLLATWVGQTRWHKRRTGLAVPLGHS